jgi:hypothetical protein
MNQIQRDLEELDTDGVEEVGKELGDGDGVSSCRSG